MSAAANIQYVQANRHRTYHGDKRTDVVCMREHDIASSAGKYKRFSTRLYNSDTTLACEVAGRSFVKLFSHSVELISLVRS